MKKITTEVSAKKEQYGTIVATVHDKYGNLKQTVEQPVDSFNRQIWRAFFGWASGNGNSTHPGLPIIRLNNTEGVISFCSVNADGAVNNFQGIVIGTGTNVTTYNKVLMDNLITHSSLGTTNTVQALESTIEYVNADRTATVTRSFLNLSSSTITINEVGIANSGQANALTSADAGLYVRDVLQTSISIDTEDVLTVQYKIRIASGNYNYSNLFITSHFGSNRGIVPITMTATDNVAYDIRSASGFWSIILTPEISAGLITNTGNTNQSLVVGTNNSAFTLNQIDLGSRVLHGNGAGQLFYHPSNYTNMVENSTTNSMRFTINRTFENRSGSSIDVKEIGLFHDSFGYRFMLDRRVVDPPVTITNSNTVTFTWEFCYTV